MREFSKKETKTKTTPGSDRLDSSPGRRTTDRQIHTELTQARNEVKRLSKNRVALLDIMLDMIFLIRSDYVIEYMNPAAGAIFGNLQGTLCREAFKCGEQPCRDCPVQLSLTGKTAKGLFERRIGEVEVEYNFISFHGYRDEQLVMLVMRDITQRKEQEAELAKIHSDIDSLLQQKIQELRESERVRLELNREVNILKQTLDIHSSPQDEMVGQSRQFRELREMINHVADSDATILITGESGTGKELVADTIHRRSQRHDNPFLKFNCAAVSETLLESDLFGYEKGSFTGANARRMGKFEIADKGTIFLDEIGDISPRMQAALLRVLQNGEIMRVGGNQSVHVNVRVITSTNVDLSTAVEKNNFRRDLYYRLNVINIHLPPLRQRKEDIVPLITHFIKKYRAAFQKEIDYIPNRILDRLLNHDWPGNIRELENVIKRAVLLAKSNVITEKELCLESNITCVADNQPSGLLEKRLLEQPLKESVAELEAKIIASALDKFGGNPQVISRVLGMSKTTFYDKMKRHGLSAGKKQ